LLFVFFVQYLHYSFVFFCFLNLTDFDEEAFLNINDPLDNPDGILIIKGDNIVVDHEEYDSFVMLYPTWGDVREVTDDTFGLKASCSKDSGAVLVTKSRFPLYFKDKIAQMWAQEELGPYEQVVNSHKILVNNVENKGAAAFLKTIRYNVGDGIKIKGGPFNLSDGLALDTELRFAPLVAGINNRKKVTSPVPYVYWHICIDKPARIISKKKAAINGDEKLARMFELLEVENAAEEQEAGNETMT
jgi:hypothetical protein